MEDHSTETNMRGISNWEKFSLLMWKNWLLVKRQKLQTVLEIVIPVVFSALLVLIRSLSDPDIYTEPFDYAPLAVINNTWDRPMRFEWSVTYSPNNSLLADIMEEVKTVMELDSIRAFENSSAMNKYLMEYELRRPLAAVAFDQSVKAGDRSLPKDLKFDLIFPAELRYLSFNGSMTNPLFNNWFTYLLYPVFQEGGPRNRWNPTGGRPPGYYNEKFITLQSAISLAFIKSKTTTTQELPNIFLQRFTYPPTTIDTLLEVFKMFVSLIFFLSFLYPCINNVKMITVEKEKQLKEAMKIMGLPSWLHWSAWFTKIMIFMIMSITLMVILLKVRWNSGTDISVFTHSDGSALWFFLVVYSLAVTTFCFMMSVLFSKANTAATIAGLMWFIFSAPYSFTQPNYNTLSFATKMAVCLFHNTGMSYGFLLIISHEANLEGLQWHNFFTPVTIDDNFSVGHVTVMLLVDTILYLLIALYIEKIFPGEYGVPEKWYFPIAKLFGMDNLQVIEPINRNNTRNENYFEEYPLDKRAGIQSKGLKKIYSNKKTAVQGLTLNMYDDEITVLLGDNGAGKTTTMSMLTGMFPPTSGTALVNGCDIRTNIAGVRQSIGLCPQHNILFDDLSVREHIIFFGKLKGLSETEVKDEVNKYVNLLELQPKIDAMSKTLSGGMKRKLSVGVALCGNSKVVLCDEPTSGMDPAARRALWDLLQLEKKGRTILLSTHFMDEADVLGDRIAIMHSGELKCYGSSFFLKKAFGSGYELICEKGVKCDVNAATSLIRKYIPDIKISSNVGSELSFKLDESYSKSFEQMLSELEDEMVNFGIDGYGISLTTLEEVFIKVTSESNGIEINGNGYDHELNGHSQEKTVIVSLNALNEPQFLKGLALFWSQIKAMVLKKILYTWRNVLLFFVQILIPVILAVITVLISKSFTVGDQLVPLTIHLDTYTNNPITLLSDHVTDNSSFNRRFVKNYEKLFENPPTERVLEKKDSIRDYILGLNNPELISFNTRNLAGVTVDNENITAWFNNQPLHTVPLTVSIVMNALMKEYCENCSITVSNTPLPFTFDSRLDMLRAGTNMGFQLASNTGFSMCFVAAFYILFYIKERVSRSKLLQFVSGINIWTFWIISFIWDFITFTITVIFLIITVFVFQEEGWKTAPEMGRLFVLLLCFVWGVLPFVYLFSMMYDIPSSGYIKTVMVGIFLGIAFFYVVFSLESPILELEHVAKGLTWGFLVVPQFALTHALNNLNLMNTIVPQCQEICDMIPICTSVDLLCILDERCCTTDYYAWESPGIGRNIVYLLTVGTTLMAILFLKELRVFDGIFYRSRNIYKGTMLPETEDSMIDNDVMDEKQRIRNMDLSEIKNYNLVMKDMTKFYKKFLAVNQISVGVEAGQCFGLLGVNGAGKTSTFKMLTGDETISGGEAWIRGISLKTDMKEIYKDIGYCPQFDALLDDLTGRETMHMFCLLRGIPAYQVKELSNKLAKELNFYKHFDKKTKEYSGGNKRKLSTALALIGNPSVVYLDEPTTGMDPGAKRHLWEVMSKYRNSGKSIILTSHSMEECEALCTKLAIMVNGEFKCLGSTQHLKTKFSNGYLLIIQMKRIPADIFSPQEEIKQVKNYVESNFTGATLKEEYQGRLSFYIPPSDLKWSTMFGMMESAKERLNIEGYSLSQTSLEQVFLSFTKYQREETQL